MKYSKKLLVVLFGISVLFFAGVQVFGQELSAEQKDVWKMEIKYWDLLKEGNLKGYMELWYKDVIAWPHWAPKPIGTEGLEKGTIPWYKFVRSHDLKPEAINLFDKFAFIYYRYSWTDPGGGKHRGRIGHLWVKEDGKWQIIGGYSGGSCSADEFFY